MIQELRFPMADRLEDRIRDYLATHLELIEQGMVLVDKEYTLPSAGGAGGRIDILAKDIFGHVVIIEIKRSDQAARQAIHEIHKYVALFRTLQGLDESRIRLILISTEWHELRLPLSEFAETTSYAIDALSITADSSGKVTSISRVELLKRSAAFKISRVQCIYLYETAKARDSVLSDLVSAVKDAEIGDFAVLCRSEERRVGKE